VPGIKVTREDDGVRWSISEGHVKLDIQVTQAVWQRWLQTLRTAGPLVRLERVRPVLQAFDLQTGQASVPAVKMPNWRAQRRRKKEAISFLVRRDPITGQTLTPAEFRLRQRTGVARSVVLNYGSLRVTLTRVMVLRLRLACLAAEGPHGYSAHRGVGRVQSSSTRVTQPAQQR